MKHRYTVWAALLPVISWGCSAETPGDGPDRGDAREDVLAVDVLDSDSLSDTSSQGEDSDSSESATASDTADDTLVTTMDSSEPDVSAPDSAAADSAAADSSVDTFTPDTSTSADSFTPDSFTPDTLTLDTFTPDTFAPDTSTLDSEPDTFAADTSTADTFTPDTAPVCASPKVTCGTACVALSSDPLNCGVCGKACAAPPNATAACASGICGVGTCNASWGDCDGDVTNGCEHDVYNDPKNCGVCGKDCYGETCAVGMCRVPISMLAGGQMGPVDLVVDATAVYWTTQQGGTTASGSVRKVSKSGGTVSTLYSGASAPFAIAVDAANVYWTETISPTFPSGAIRKVPISGGTPSTLATGTPARHIAVDATHVYWLSTDTPAAPCFCSTSKTTSVMRVPVGGGSPEPLWSFPGEGADLAVNSTNLYVAMYGTYNATNFRYDDGMIAAWPKAGGSLVYLALNEGQPLRLRVDGTYAFWSKQSAYGSAIRREPLAGGTVISVTAGRFDDFALDTSDIFLPAGGIRRVSKNGGSVTTLVTGQTLMRPSIAVDGTGVYWLTTDPGDGKVLTAPK